MPKTVDEVTENLRSELLNRLETKIPALLVCVECRRPWLDRSEHWRLKVMDEEPRETVPYCPECASREFGAARTRRCA